MASAQEDALHQIGDRISVLPRDELARHIRVFLDGEDVTTRCAWALMSPAPNEEVDGRLSLYALRPGGGFELDATGEPVTALVDGRVSWVYA